MDSGAPGCRSCGAAGLKNILSLGRMPLANALLNEGQLHDLEPVFPLDLAFCTRCSLGQLLETVPPERLFREYVYFSSFSETTLRHAEELADRMISSRRLGQKELVVEIASNDGYLLQYYRRKDIPVLGIEPAENVARVAEKERGIETLREFFCERLAHDLSKQGVRADVIHSNNVLAHVPDLNGFVRGMSLLLKQDGIALIEVPYIRSLVDRCEFDTIYHEHVSYFSLTSLGHLFRRHGLDLYDVEQLPIHGGSLRIWVRKAAGSGSAFAEPSKRVEQLLREETESGVDRLPFYISFRGRVEGLRGRLLDLLKGLKAQRNRIAAYGASAKGSTLLNYCGIGAETIDFVVDRSTAKQGLYTPGTHLPIYSPERLRALVPDYLLLLTWNFADEILAQQTAFRDRGGHFIIPIPEPKVV